MRFKYLAIFLIITSLVICPVVEAKSRGGGFNVTGIIKAILKTYGVNIEQLEMAEKELEELQRQYEMYEEQLKSLEKQREALTGTNSYGLKDFQSSVDSWFKGGSSIDKLQNSFSQGQGPFARLAQKHEGQFPIDTKFLTNSSFTRRDIDYYTLSAKTALSTRTASEIEFDKIEEKLKAQESLQTSIDTTTDLKQSVDLLARMQAENNKIMIENLRMLAVLTQQSAVAEQAQVNARIQNAKFLTN